MDHNLENYGKDPPTNIGDFLFGKEFCTQLKGKVELDKALTQVVCLSNCYQPYDKSCHTTLGCSKRQFFQQGPAGKLGSQQGQTSPSNRNYLPNTSSVGLPTINQQNRGNPKAITSTTCVLSSTRTGHEPPCPAPSYASSRKDSSVSTELEEANPRPLGDNNHGIPDTIGFLAKAPHNPQGILRPGHPQRGGG